MRLPQPQLDSLCFLLETSAELISAIGADCLAEESDEIGRLCESGLPPITSHEALSVMFGYNLGFIWSLLNRTNRYYRHFEIPKGLGSRPIDAPQVALKAIQKWLSVHFQRCWEPNENVFGFIPGRSHIDAANRHLSAEWIYSVDIENFFPSVSIKKVCDALRTIGYITDDSIKIISTLCCLNNHLVQGAPCSPVLSNIVLQSLDRRLSSYAAKNDLMFTRYADDIVFSGKRPVKSEATAIIKSMITDDGWTISEHKECLSEAPKRLKVHGLLVHGERLRLTKRYRNQIRAYQHLLENNKINEDDLDRIRGHLNYASQIDEL